MFIQGLHLEFQSVFTLNKVKVEWFNKRKGIFAIWYKNATITLVYSSPCYLNTQISHIKLLGLIKVYDNIL